MVDAFDAYVRNQVYVEGYKNGQGEDAETLFEEITAVILLLLTRRKITNLGELSKMQLLAFTREVSTKVKEIYGKQVVLTMKDIKAFMANGLSIMGKLTDTFSDKASGYGAINQDRLWGTITKDPIAGVGLSPLDVMAEAQAVAIAAILKLIRMAWANAQSVADFTAALVGTRAFKQKDGLISRQRRNFVTAIETTIQHVSSEINFRLGAMTTSHYVWCSILDSRTTEICRSRNGNSYPYGNGPRPPAHWNCRSFTIPATIVGTADIPTFNTWIRRQPRTIQDDVLGPTRGKELRERQPLPSEPSPGFERTRPLTAKQYGDKLNQILTEVA